MLVPKWLTDTQGEKYSALLHRVNHGDSQVEDGHVYTFGVCPKDEIDALELSLVKWSPKRIEIGREGRSTGWSAYSSCGLCNFYDEECTGCPLGSCGPGSFFWDWCSYCVCREKEAGAAIVILQKILDRYAELVGTADWMEIEIKVMED
jgi:hypothetical protein